MYIFNVSVFTMFAGESVSAKGDTTALGTYDDAKVE